MSGKSQDKTGIPKPPETAERLLLSLLPEQVRDNVSGDLSEIFSVIIVPSYGVSRARLWYWLQAVSSIRLIFRFRKNPQVASGFCRGQFPIHKPMHNFVAYHPGISMHHIPVGSNVPGLLITLGLVFIICVGVPACLDLLVVSGSLGLLASRVTINWYSNHPLEIQALDLHKLKS